jgi:pimeloyl-ACP methyl ester carboxylesterase
VLWDGENPETAELAPKVRRLVDNGGLPATAGQLAIAVYGYGGAALLEREIDLLLRGRTVVWQGLERLGRSLVARKTPYRNEPDLVGRIGFSELNYADVPDGKPLDPALAMRELALKAPPFETEPFDLVAEMPKFGWPTAVLSGSRDLITPPAIAAQVASLIPDAVLVTLPTAAHSIIDTRERAALSVIKAVASGQHHRLPAQAAKLDRLPGSLTLRLLVSALGAAAAAEAALPAIRPFASQGVVHR